uniref:Permuted papain-like amidase enzyme, YaeF/YiiX, C92 family n=1 Tax=Candidatus Kentrum sp. LFY TaxID=2126342 RepID=A0A450WH48_9GAMM|nr:MAG: hypothetical protein BECKLFY1418C_GA0070996_102248 [Candidatus Kentron sp. LFY]
MKNTKDAMKSRTIWWNLTVGLLTLRKRIKVELDQHKGKRMAKENYPAIRDRIQSGDVIAYHGNLLLHLTIIVATGRPWVHVGTTVVSDGRVWILESRLFKNGVTFVPLSSRIKKGAYLFPSGSAFTEEQKKKAYAEIEIVKYSLWDAIRAGFGRGPKYLGKHCAELLAYLHGTDALTPADIVDWALER